MSLTRVTPVARLIDGRALAAALREEVAAAAARLRERHGVVPGLAAVLVGDDPASEIYVRSKARACREAGIASFEHRLPADCAMPALLELIASLNADDRVDGILVQLPLPAGLDPSRVIGALDPAKDVDGFHPVNVGLLWSGKPGLVPCTPQGVMLLLRSVRQDLSGADAVVLGRSQIVGRPTAALLLASDCTVTIVHSKTQDAAAICRRADILVAAMGRPAMVTADWIKPGAIVIDVGISRIAGPRARRAGHDAACRRCRFRGGAADRGRDHAGAGRRRADDDRLPAAKHGTGRVPAARPPRSDPAAGLSDPASYGSAGTAVCWRLFQPATVSLTGVAVMTSKAVIGMAFAAGCALALGVVPPANGADGCEHTGPDERAAGEHGRLRQLVGRAQQCRKRPVRASAAEPPGLPACADAKECGPITDAQLRSQCMASFGESSSMMTGSSMPPSQGGQHWGNGY